MKDILRRILKARGYELEDTGNWLVAKKDGMRINIGFLSRDMLDKKELESLKGKKIVVPLDDYSFDDVKDIVVLNKKELGDEFAQILLGEMDFSSANIYKLLADDKTWDDITVQRMGDYGESIIKPVMTFKDVMELSKKTVEGFRYILELVPHYLFRFSCELNLEDEQIKKSGLISVNALTKKCEIWNRDFETISMLEHAHKKLEPKLGEKEALALAKRCALEKSTTVVERVKEKEHTVVMEDKRIGPKDDELTVEGEGLLYLPIWCVEGTNGVMIVDAAAGKIIEEDYYVKGFKSV